MTETTIFIIALMFTDFDACWDYYHKHKPAMQEVELAEFCEKHVELTYAPRHSLRPVARGDNQ